MPYSRSWPHIVGLVAVALLSSNALAQSADRPVLPGRYYLRFGSSPQYLDVAGASPAAGSPLHVWQKLGAPNQIWEVIKSPERGYYYLRSDMGRYLDVQWGSAAAGTPVHIWDFTGTNAQKWRFRETGGRTVLQSRLGTYLQTASDPVGNGVRVTMGTSSAGRAGWRLEPAEIIPGSYYLKTSLTTRYLDVYAVRPDAGTPLQIWDKAGGPNQKWELIPAPESGYFFLQSDLGRFLDVQWGSAASGTPVHIWDFNGGDAQKWRVDIQADGTVALRSKLGTYLGVTGGGTENGARVAMSTEAAGAARRWSLEPIVAATELHGWADLHTHPMSHLGFGKKLMHGAPDVGSLIPAGTRDCNRSDVRATSISQALGHCNSAHGGWGTDNGCGDYVRAAVLSNAFDRDFVHKTSNLHGDHEHQGYPQLTFWPHQSSISHQQMWWEWIKRAHQGGLRGMVALAVNSELLATVINGDAPRDDRASADLQLDELRAFVGRHGDFMEVALSAADYRRIVSTGKLAVILGVEIDNIGNFNKSTPTLADVRAELRRLHDKGARYIFPVHVVDNKFGGAAVYEDLFNYATKFSTGAPFTITSATDPQITKRLSAGEWWLPPVLNAISGIPYPPAFDLLNCPTGTLGCWDQFRRIYDLVAPDARVGAYSRVPGGHVNALGLSALGELAVAEMMRMGMLIDIDHMSDRSKLRTIEIAEWITPGGYPLMIGHNGIRSAGASERSVSAPLAIRVGRLGGMLGVGTSNTDATQFIASYERAFTTMGRRVAALGSDANGFERLPRASAGLSSAGFYTGFSKARTGTREWDYTAEGAAHYGLMWDFLRDAEQQPNGPAVVGNLHRSAESLARTWERAEQRALRAIP